MKFSERMNKLKTGKFFGRLYGIILLASIAFAFWGVFMLLTPGNFGTPRHLYFYLQSSIIFSVGACGFYFIVVMGLFDFSIGANVVLSSIVGVILSRQYGYAGLLFGCIACGTAIGFLNGFLYIKLKIPSMIVTIGLLLIYESIASFAAQGQKQSLPPALQGFGRAPGNMILAFTAFMLAGLIIRYTKIGTYCYAIGSNEYVAKNMGINVNKYKLYGFMLLHFFVGIMAVLSVSYGTSMTAITGMGSMARNFTPLMGCFFGLAFKKYGSPIIAIVVGGFIIAIIFNGFIAMGAPTTIQNVVTGAALLAIVALTLKHEKGAIVK
ncbi:MAG: ABC transporter permease [Synergistaceae bacterium]|nr:ABC transporter permease [Synergistaceae bacterium]